MEKEIIERWEKGKENLRTYFSTHSIEECCSSYQQVVDTLIKQGLNFEVENKWDLFAQDFSYIDDGDYQGTQLYLLHKDVYQPYYDKYYVFDNEYGSCSGCDTLMSIIDYGDYDSCPNEEMVDGLMILCLHMVQRMKCLSQLWDD